MTEEEKIICKEFLNDADNTHSCNEYKLLMALLEKEPTTNLENSTKKYCGCCKHWKIKGVQKIGNKPTSYGKCNKLSISGFEVETKFYDNCSSGGVGMTREELKKHCEKQIEACEMWAKYKRAEPHGKVYEEHKLILQMLEQEPILDKITELVEPLRHLSFDEMTETEWQILQVIDKHKAKIKPHESEE